MKKHQQEVKQYEEALAQWKQAESDAEDNGEPTPPKPPPPAPAPARPVVAVGSFYETLIRPFVPYGIRGVLWDQGESGTAVPGVDQYTLMGGLIAGWRKEWGQGEFPFIYVQKPSGGGCAWDNAVPVTRRAEAFEALPAEVPGDGAGVGMHIAIMRYPNTGMAICSDLGSGLHPANKSGYGHRAADVALGMVYKRNVEYYGPVYDAHTIAGAQVRIRFTHVGQGLAFKNGDGLQGFAVAGEDKVFHWAQARIDGEAVVLTSDKVPSPVAVRYAWASRRTWANLFNRDGLPALPFRTDAW